MKPTFVNSLAEMMAAMGMELIPNVPNDTQTMNRLLLQQIVMQKLMIASLDVGIDWDTFQVWIEPGVKSTKIVDVQPGDVVVVKINNHDQDIAGVVYYGQGRSVQPQGNEGRAFPRTRVVVGVNDAWDFDELGPNFTFVVAPGEYIDGAAVALQLQTGMNSVLAANTYSVEWLDAEHIFMVKPTNAAPVPYNIVPATGPNAATSIGPSIGWPSDVSVIASPWEAYSSDRRIATITPEEHFLNGQPLLSGDETTLVLEESLYGILDPTAILRVPLAVRRSRIVTRNRI